MNAVIKDASEPRLLKAVQATPELLAPYGEVLGYNPAIAPLPIEFYDGAVKVRRVVNFISDEQTEMPVCTVNRRPLEVRWMERHAKHTQAFIPLGGAPFVVVMAPPTAGELPDLDAVRAFLFDGSAGFVMKLGTWHEFPFAVIDATQLIVVLRREATAGLAKDNMLANEAHGPDLDKKDLVARCGVSFRVEI